MLHSVHALFTKCIFMDSYPQCIRVIHVENVENPVESVENFPPLHVPMVENLWKTGEKSKNRCGKLSRLPGSDKRTVALPRGKCYNKSVYL